MKTPIAPGRSPIIKGTGSYSSIRTQTLTQTPHLSAGALKTTIWKRQAKATLAAITVTASVIGALTTIGGFANTLGASSDKLLAAPPSTTLMDSLHPAVVDDDNCGELTVAAGQGTQVGSRMAMRQTRMDAKISGYISRVTVTQTFQNPYSHPVDAVYNFPLSNDAAVDDMTVKIGERTIKGEIKSKKEAVRIYSKARAAGQTAALLNQEKTNIFTQQIANIEPGKEITVKISYVELLKFENGNYSLTMPTTIKSRYNSPAYTSAEGQGNRLSINVDIDAGLKIKNINSKEHAIMTFKSGPNKASVALKNSYEKMDRDFTLTYELEDPAALRSGYIAYRDKSQSDKKGYISFLVLPPDKVTKEKAAPKEMVFLVDCSGSQAGRPMEKARETMHYIVDHMNAEDTFQVIAFAGSVETLADQPIQNTPRERLKAHHFIDSLQAGGGTWMAPAVESVMRMSRPTDDIHRLRIVTFMTDGRVGNDTEIMAMVQKHRDDSRWFVFGTGDSVNRNLIENVARLGGGEAEYVLPNSDVKEIGKRFYERLAAPCLTDIKLSGQGLRLLDMQPAVCSDVWEKKPIYFTARYDQAASGQVVLSGFSEGRPYRQIIDVTLPDNATANSAIKKIWARQTIASLTDKDLNGLAGGSMDPQIANKITTVALDAGVVSDFTSFVAVDKSGSHVTRSANAKDLSEEIAAEDALQSAQQAIVAQTRMPAGGPTAVAQFPVQAETVPTYTMASSNPNIPELEGATNGSISPEKATLTLSRDGIVSGVNTSGNVRVNNLANMEAALNILVNLFEVAAIAVGIPYLLIGLSWLGDDNKRAARNITIGLVCISAGLVFPGLVNWIVASSIEPGLYN